MTAVRSSRSEEFGLKAILVLLTPAMLAALLAGCVSPIHTLETESSVATSELSGELMVFAAASLTDAFDRLGQTFEARHPQVDIQFNYAGSQQLAQQLAQGAPADLFASADWAQMETAVNSGRITPTKAVPFASNQLVIIVPTDNPAMIESVFDLAESGSKLIIAAEAVPVGRYTRHFLTNATDSPDFAPGFADAVLANVVSYEQNVRAVLSKVILGEADAGIVYGSDVTRRTDQVTSVAIPDSVNVSADYPIAPLDDSDEMELADVFISFVRSSEGQSILVEHGFLPSTSQE